MLIRHDTGGFAATTAPNGFDLEDFERAGVRVVERRFKAKDTIFTPGDPDEQLYFLLEGTVRLYKIYGDYKEATVALLREGGVFQREGVIEIQNRMIVLVDRDALAVHASGPSGLGYTY